MNLLNLKLFKGGTGYKTYYDVAGAIGDVQGMIDKGFQYNPMTDAAYQSYAKEYARLGEKARQNTLGEVAANTGGLASSYAVSAANQAQNDYNRQLTAMIPQLQEAAYQRYNNQIANAANLASLRLGAEDSRYGRWNDTRNLNYQQSRDKVADDQWSKSFDYQKSRDKIADQQWYKEYLLSKKASESSGRRSSGGGSKSGGKKSSGGSNPDTPSESKSSKIKEQRTKTLSPNADKVLKKAMQYTMKRNQTADDINKALDIVDNAGLSKSERRTVYYKLGLQKYL